MTGRALAYGCLLAGVLLGFVAGAQPWWSADADGAAVELTGTEVTGGLSQALGLVALTGMVTTLALRARGRRAMGLALALVGAGQVLLGALAPRPSADAVRAAVREVSLTDQFALGGTAWPWLFAAAGLITAAGGIVVVTTVRRWPVRSDRFRQQPAAAVPGMEEDPAQVWRAMDAGVDPTVDLDSGPPRSAPATSPESAS